MPGTKTVDAMRKAKYMPQTLGCIFPGCNRRFSKSSGRTNHMNVMHPFYQPSGMLGQPELAPSQPRSAEHQDLPEFFNDDLRAESPVGAEPEPKSTGYIYEYHPLLNGQSLSLLHDIRST